MYVGTLSAVEYLDANLLPAVKVSQFPRTEVSL